MQTIEDYLAEVMPRYKKQLAGLVSIPSVSAGDDHGDDLHGMVMDLVDIGASLGFTARTVQDTRYPLFVAKLEVDPNAPWDLVYNHADVQPADEPEWKTTPFAPVVTDTMIIGRGTTDDKGPLLATMYGIAYAAKAGLLKRNVEIVVETEEESGSTTFETNLRRLVDAGVIHKPASIFVSDTEFEGDRPTLSTSLKGLIYATASLTTGTSLVHSGLGGGVVKNPLNILAQAMSSCYNAATGRVRIPGWYEGISDVTDETLDQLRDIEGITPLAQVLQDLEAGETYAVDPILGRKIIWYDPTFELHGFHHGVSGTKIPYKASVEFSARLVGGQDGNRCLSLLRNYLQQTHHGITIENAQVVQPITVHLGRETAAAETACVEAFGQKPLYVGSGGTIGALLGLQNVFSHVPMTILSMSLATDGYHKPNEKFEWRQAEKGIKATAAYFRNLSAPVQ